MMGWFKTRLMDADEVISENSSLFTDQQALSKIAVVLTALTREITEINGHLDRIADRIDEASDG